MVRSLPGLAEPIVRHALVATDWQNLATGVSRLGRAMFAAGARIVYPAIYGHAGWTTPEQCDEFLEGGLPRDRTNLMTIHLFSSCPPGEDKQRCATDSFGRLHGVENLVIADGSQIPEAPGVNPQATIMALAFRAAERAMSSAGDARRLAFSEAAA
jgi:choline dehydrogenase-like flavoprotein